MTSFVNRNAKALMLAAAYAVWIVGCASVSISNRNEKIARLDANIFDRAKAMGYTSIGFYDWGYEDDGCPQVKGLSRCWLFAGVDTQGRYDIVTAYSYIKEPAP